MINLNVVSVADNSVINGSIKGQNFNIPFSKESYDQLLNWKKESEETEEMKVYMDIMEKAIEYVSNSDNRETDVITTKCKDICKKKGKYYLVSNDIVSEFAIPERLMAKIEESVDKDIDPTPIVKAWTRFLRNKHILEIGDMDYFEAKAENFAKYITATIVDYSKVSELVNEQGYSRELATEIATFNEVSITNEGLIVAKKFAELNDKKWQINPETNEAELVDKYTTVKTINEETGEITETINYPEFAEELTFIPPMMRERGDAFFCGDTLGHKMKVGEVIKLPSWDYVDCNDEITCVQGLHCGGYSYCQGYAGQFNQLLDCFVSPEDIGALVDLNRGDGAIRVLRYYINGASGKPTKNLYHSSKYAKILDEEWENYKKEAIEKSNEKIKSLENIA